MCLSPRRAAEWLLSDDQMRQRHARMELAMWREYAPEWVVETENVVERLRLEQQAALPTVEPDRVVPVDDRRVTVG